MLYQQLKNEVNNRVNQNIVDELIVFIVGEVNRKIYKFMRKRKWKRIYQKDRLYWAIP